MILDSSVLVSILLKESGYEALVQKVKEAAVLFVATPAVVESAIVVSSRLRCDARPLLAGLLYRMSAEIVDFNQEHYEAAVSAYLRFGKGRHAAGLNFGDCMCYALAAVSGLPLLYTGTDFARTDIQSA
ncbi:MAG TPA: type II toxin-antitoxin system VapC family toxin [Terriglobales bacterium]|jgi:ribonuclease VapC|nr:type II toxin-antitoxin system VapC family toxin [Terriglobales bacterium]